MFKLVVVAVVVTCALASVVPKTPTIHSDVKHDAPAVKSAPLHPEIHSSTESHKPADGKADVKHEDKAKAISSHDNKSDEKEKMQHHQPTAKKVEHHNDHHAALKHHEVPVNVGHGVKPGVAGHEAHKPEKVESVKAKPSEHGH